MTTKSQNLSLHGRPSFLEVVVLLAPVLAGLVVTFLLPPLPPPSRFWTALVAQSAFVLAPLAVAFSGRLSWGSVGLQRAALERSLALGVLYSLILLVPTYVAYWLGYLEPRFLITAPSLDEPSRYLGVPLAVALFLPFWGLFESVWMCYLIYAMNRWLTGGGALRWRALFLAALLFGLLHTFTQLVRGAPLPQALGSVMIGLALLIPGTIPKLTGNAWGLVLFFTVSNF